MCILRVRRKDRNRLNMFIHFHLVYRQQQTSFYFTIVILTWFAELNFMAIFKRRINTSLLPNDILSYSDTQFYDVAKQIVSNNAANLLECLGIRSAHSLLLIPDVFVIFDINRSALTPLKEKLCLKSDDDTYIVKPGIKSSMNFFYDLIMKNQDE